MAQSRAKREDTQETPDKVPDIGSGLAQKAKEAIMGRKSRLDRMEEEAMGSSDKKWPWQENK